MLAYDPTANRVKMQDSTGRYTYAYDPVDRKIMVALPSTQRMTYAFDAVGQRRSLIAPTGGRFSYSFDQAGRIDWVQNPEVSATTYPYDKSARYAYDAASRRTIKYLPDGTRAAFAYDAANQTAEVGNLALSQMTVTDYINVSNVPRVARTTRKGGVVTGRHTRTDEAAGRLWQRPARSVRLASTGSELEHERALHIRLVCDFTARLVGILAQTAIGWAIAPVSVWRQQEIDGATAAFPPGVLRAYGELTQDQTRAYGCGRERKPRT